MDIEVTLSITDAEISEDAFPWPWHVKENFTTEQKRTLVMKRETKERKISQSIIFSFDSKTHFADVKFCL